MKYRVAVLGAVLSLCACRTRTVPTGDACEPNPCNEANKNLCADEEGVARCLCNTGYISRPSGACEEVNANNCPEHGGDAAEPDDCSTRAKALTLDAAKNQTIEPVGDYDFFRFDGVTGNLYRLTAQVVGSLYPRIDVFDQGGVLLATAETVGTASVLVKARTTAAYDVRVSHSPVDPSVGTGSYALTWSAAGVEDHGDGPAQATYLSPTAPTSTSSVSGSLETAGDVDWFRFNGTTTQVYTLQFDSAKIVPVVALFTGGNTTTPQWETLQTTVEFDLPANETVYFELSSPVAQGPYSFTLTQVPK